MVEFLFQSGRAVNNRVYLSTEVSSEINCSVQIFEFTCFGITFYQEYNLSVSNLPGPTLIYKSYKGTMIIGDDHVYIISLYSAYCFQNNF